MKREYSNSFGERDAPAESAIFGVRRGDGRLTAAMTAATAVAAAAVVAARVASASAA